MLYYIFKASARGLKVTCRQRRELEKKFKLGQNCPKSNIVPSLLDVNACSPPDIGRCTNLRQKSHVTMMDLQGSYSNHKFNDGDSFFEVIDLAIEYFVNTSDFTKTVRKQIKILFETSAAEPAVHAS